MIAGIVCEYNPFHNGHLYHINETRKKADYIVCAMSGNFVQRGECAFSDKWTRAKLAVLNGADVVIDLPVPWSCASAETFARGSVGLLADFGVDMISFGSECDDLSLLEKCAEFAVSRSAGTEIKKLMSEGYSYPLALCEAAGKYLSPKAGSVLLSPNSTLAVEYIKAVNTQNKKIALNAVKRIGSDHDSDIIFGNTASALKIRSLGLCDETASLMPEQVFGTLCTTEKEGFLPCRLQNAERAILSSLRDISPEEYCLYVSDENGLAFRIHESVRVSSALDELYGNIKCKSYTLARIKREVLSLYLKIPKQLSEGTPPYIRILAVSEKGLKLLSEAKETAPLPIITKHSETSELSQKGKAVYDIQCSSTDKFALMSKKIRPCGLEQINSMFIEK